MHVYKRFLGYFRPHVPAIILGILASTVVAASTGMTAYIIKPTLDGIFIAKDRNLLMIMPLVIIGIYFVRSVFRYIQNYILHQIGQRVVQRVRDELYDKMIVLPVRFYSANSTGGLMSRVMNDVNRMQQSLTAIVNVFREVVSAIGLVFVVMYMDWKLGLISLVVLPVMVYPIIKIGQRIKGYSHKSQEKMGDLSTVLAETFTGIRVVKAFVAENRERERFTAHNAKQVRYEIKRIILNGITSPLMEFIGSLALGFIIFYGGLQVINGESTPGTFFAFMTAISLLYEPFRKISTANNEIQAAIAAAERVYEIIDSKNEILDNDGTLDCDAKDKSIRFENVAFEYSEADGPVLQDINLTIEPGMNVAFVGSSGSGKSTLVSLIPRFYDVTDGTITIDGVDLRDYTSTSLRKNIGIVSQDPFLFNATVAENIAYGRPDAPMEEIREAAKNAYALDFIEQLPGGFDTVIGERGVRLSGGQKQRLTIARALLSNPPILILDEATSALDTESERIVQKALDNLMKGRTSFVIAHRLSTILSADAIVVLVDGKIEAIGRHDDLVANSATYHKLYTMQFRDE